MPLHPCTDACRLIEMEDRMKVLEREHAEFYDRWHDERRKREALQVAMIEARKSLVLRSWDDETLALIDAAIDAPNAEIIGD